MKRIFIMLLILGIVGCYNKEQGKEEVKERLVDCPKDALGINLNKLTAEKLLHILNTKKVKYGIYYYEDFPKTPNIVTDYFIGQGIDKGKIRRVMYSFSPFTGIPDIEIEMEGKYLNQLIKYLKNNFGEPTEYIAEDNEYYIKWKCKDQSKSTIEFIAINKGKSLYFYEDFGLKADKEKIYLLIRPREYGCDHVH
ncbi:MAG: hypothetical protein WBK20_03785 [Spirochaetota bacterium]